MLSLGDSLKVRAIRGGRQREKRARLCLISARRVVAAAATTQGKHKFCRLFSERGGGGIVVWKVSGNDP